jgi:2-keto-3-deoxy-L-rhamnonate aldolase RhmA
MCVLVQIETREALKNLPQILDVEGVDGVFIGPADLSADMGFAAIRSTRRCRPPLRCHPQIRRRVKRRAS